MDLISCSLKVLFAILDPSSFHSVYYPFSNGIFFVDLVQHVYNAPGNDSSRPVAIRIVTATVRWDGMEYCFFMKTTLLRKDQSMRGKSMDFDTIVAPGMHSRQLHAFLLRTSYQHDGIPVMIHPTANCEVVKIACSKSPCPCMYFFTVCPWRFCFGFDINIQTILRARVMLQTRIQGWICNASFRDIIVMIRAVWIYHSANTFTFWAFIELC